MIEHECELRERLRSVEFPGTFGNVASGNSGPLSTLVAPEFLKMRQAGHEAHARNDGGEVFQWNRGRPKTQLEIGLLGAESK
jgi:hypothetical protein